MNWNNFNILLKESQERINLIYKEIDLEKNNLAKAAQQIYDEIGLDGLKRNNYGYDPNWLGVAGITVGDSDNAEYLFPDGLNDNYSGWVPSSYLD